jgi:hypothetical protein
VGVFFAIVAAKVSRKNKNTKCFIIYSKKNPLSRLLSIADLYETWE